MMQPTNIESSGFLSLITQETETFLEDIFLSGFHSIRQNTMEKLEQILELYQTYGLKEGSRLLTELKAQLRKRQESFAVDTDSTMKAYCRLEFYLEHMKSGLDNL